MDIDQIIQEYIEPMIGDECERLGIPPSFIIGVHAGTPSTHSDKLAGAKCIPVRENGNKYGKITGVRIHFNERENRPRGARGAFFHEFRHARDYYNNEPLSELKAYSYMLKRGIEEDCKTIVNKLKGCILFLFNHSYL